VDVRFVAATNRSLAKAVQMGQFRRDLFHRLNVVRVQIPPLRRRPEDVEPILDHYLHYFASEYGMEPRKIDADLRTQLREYPWPGNVRELCCWIERLYATGLPPMAPQPDVWDDQYANGEPLEPPAPVTPTAEPAVSAEPSSLEDTEIDAIQRALQQADGNRSEAARILNIHRTTLLRKLKQYSLA
jgi:DNA-binding NtrC family response regulator